MPLPEMRLSRIATILALFLMVPLQVPAASPTKATDRYEIEVLIFRNDLAYLEGEELWTRDTVDTKLPTIDEAIEMRGRLVPDSVLSKAAVTLQAGRGYRVIAHKRWVQNAESRSTAKWVRVKNTNKRESDLDGTLRFYQGRYLHVELELLFRDSAVGVVSFVRGNNPTAQIYRISEHRRVRNRQVNYFDHPKFGALVRVALVEKAN